MLGFKLAITIIVYEILKFEKIKTIIVHGEEILVRTNSPDVKVVLRTLFNSEFNDIKCPSAKVIIDVGAYIGSCSIYFAKKYPNATIYAIEPETHNYDLLLKNTKNYKNVITIKSAIWGTKEKRELLNRFTGHWGYTISNTANKTTTTNQFIHCLTISDILDKYNIAKIDILKLDVEGSEKSILNNSEVWIDNVAIIIAELHDRIIFGCDRAFYLATKRFTTFEKKGEKITAYRDS